MLYRRAQQAFKVDKGSTMVKTPFLILGAASLLALSACTDPSFGPGGERQRTGQGAAAGAAGGALLGAIIGDSDDRGRNAVIGAAAGAIAGGLIGQQLDRQAAELRQDFDSDQIDVINTGSELVVRMPQDILFAVDSAEVSSGLRSDLGVLATSLNRYPGSTVTVVGHTDNTGTAQYNQGLSERRAQSVTSILVQNGVSPARLRAFGAGENQPLASNLTPEGRAQNRRVDITIQPTDA